MRYMYIYIWLLISLNNKAQVNFVPNPSFEDTLTGACGYGMGINSLDNWYRSNVSGTPDIFSYCFNSNFYPSVSSIPRSCLSYQYPQDGNLFIGLVTYALSSSTDSSQIFSENFGIKLKTQLKPNYCYYSSMYVTLANVSTIATNQISMLYTPYSYTTSLYSYTNTIQPQVQWDTTKYFTDTLNWVKISGYFIAQGGEQYLTIGNFKDGTHLKKTFIGSNFVQIGCNFTDLYRTYFNIDNVSLYELPNHTGTQSYTLCAGDSLLLGDTVTLPVRYQWSLNGVVVDTTKNITIKNAGTYILQTKHCTTQTQTITVIVDDGCNTPLEAEPVIPNVFTPNGDGVNDTFSFTVAKASNLKFTVYNRWGNIEHLTSNIDNLSFIKWDGRTTSGEACSAGVYFYVLEYTNANGDVKKKNGYISLIK